MMKNIFYAFLLAGIAIQVFGLDGFCKGKKDGHYQYPKDCSKFHQCSNGRTFVMPCPPNTWYSVTNDTCEYPNTIHPKPKCTPPSAGAYAAASNGGASPTTTTKALQFVPRPECQGNVHGSVPHQSECSKFVKCDGNGLGAVKSCPPKTNFDPDYRVCVWESIFDCKGPNFCKGKLDGDYVHPSRCDAFYKCVGGLTYTEVCPNGLWYNGTTNKCDYQNLVNCPVSPTTPKPITTPPTTTTTTTTTLATTTTPTTATTATTTTVHPSLQGFCNGKKDGNFENPLRCDQFLSCVAGRVLYVRNCPAGLYYNEKEDLCDYPRNVNCPQKSSTTTTTTTPTTTTTTTPTTTTTTPTTTTTTTTTPTTTTTTPTTTTTTTTTPTTTTTTTTPTTTTTTTQSSTPSLKGFCDNRKDGNYENPHKCEQFISCVAMRIVYVRNCPAGLYYNEKTDECDWPSNVKCNPSPTASQQTTKVVTKPSTITTQPLSPITKSTSLPTTVDPTLKGFCNSRTDGNYDHPKRCDQFVSCVAHRIVYVRNCPSGLYYNKNLDQCDWPRNVNCAAASATTSPPPPVTTAKSSPSCVGKADGNYIDPDRCDGFVSCSNGIANKMDCPVGLWYDKILDQCDDPHNVQCSTTPQSTTTTTTTTKSPSTIVPLKRFCESKHPGDYRDPARCEGYISCVGNIGYIRNCPSGLHFNDVLGVCDYPVNVQCNSRISKRVVDEFSCAGKPGGTYKHEQCNKYYQCKDNSGQTEVKECPKHMNFHPTSQVCVWSYSFSCEDPKFCTVKENGKYKNTFNCYGYYECDNGRTYPKSCPPFLRFNGADCVPASSYTCN